ncbi:MAG TPA: acyl-CoA dehydrogenase family protein [Mycobacteriales bacterium]|nr:acyl-CoA dehydrogenase family protein [Mycobacteriales bacterium]
MDFAFSDEQQMLRAATRDFLAARLPVERVAELADADPGWDPASWRQVVDLGWVGLSIAEDRGGAGMTFVDEAVVFEEAGRGLYPGPLFSTVALALPLLDAAEDRAPLGAVLAGDRTATVGRGAGVTVDGGRLTGTARLVPDAAIADDLLVVSDEGTDNPAVWRVDLAADRSVVRPCSTMDRTRRYGDVVLDGTPATSLLTADRAADALAVSRLRGQAALACEAVGVAQRCLDIAAEHATQRHQFGRPIGSYQGVSHRVANIYVSLELARSLAYWAAWCVSVGDEQAESACAAAKSAGAEAAVFAAENAIQAMGGIGFTWDHPLHRFYKRAQWIASYDGFPREHRARLAAALLDA